MRIGILLPATHALDGVSNGVRSAALGHAGALRRLGHKVALLEPWNIADVASLDVVQFYQGGCGHYQIERKRPRPVRLLSFSAQIDSNEPQWRYRLAAEIGRRIPRFFTIPRLLADQARGSDVVVVRSTHERERVVRGLGVEPAKVALVLNGIDPPPPADAAPARAAFNLPGAYALHVSRYADDNKNVVRLCEAIGPTGLPLYLAGPAQPGANLDRIKTLAERYPAIVPLPFLERTVLQSLYAGCKVFCLPSIHEGTGLVALEAAAHGAEIVITSHGGPPDYFREWGHYCDPFDVESIRRAFLSAWDTPARDALRRHVLENLTWDRSAVGLVAAWERAAHA